MRKLTVQEIQSRLNTLYHNDVLIDGTTYKNTSTKARFVSKIFGEWFSKPNDVLLGHGNYKYGYMLRQKTCLEKYGVSHPSKMESVKEKKKETLLKNYGVDNPNKSKDIALRIAKSSNNVTIKFHWKTNEELICQASYEPKVVDYLNQHKIDFLWQPKVFTMSDGRTYRPDLYLINENKWIEIKGWMRKDAQEKWDWFQSIYPTAKLWDKKELVNLKIL